MDAVNICGEISIFSHISGKLKARLDNLLTSWKARSKKIGSQRECCHTMSFKSLFQITNFVTLDPHL